MELTNEEIFELGPGKCLVCGKEIKNNAAGRPTAMKLAVLELHAYTQQKISLTGPDQWICNNCIRKLMKHAMDSTESFNDLMV